MVRNMDLIRQLLLDIEAAPAEELFAISAKNGSDYPEHTFAGVWEHLELLVDGGFITPGEKVEPWTQADSRQWYGLKLTWKGAEFLADIKSDTTWNRLKAEVGRQVGTASVAMLWELARHFGRERFGIP